MGSRNTQGPNHSRRLGPGFLLVLAYPALKLLTRILGRKDAAPIPGDATSGPTRDSLIVYQDYQVGDLFMAMPAIRLLARHMQVTILCRPDCLFLFRDLALPAVGFHNPFFARASAGTLRTALRNAWALRGDGRIRGEALDLDADPRSAFFLKVAGAGRTHAYARQFSWLFDATFPLPPSFPADSKMHQADKNLAVAKAFLRMRGLLPSGTPAAAGTREGTLGGTVTGLERFPVPESEPERSAVKRDPRNLVLSCWTRKDEKNWSLENWDRVAGFLWERGMRAQILVPPDGDAEFHRFRVRWQDRLEFLTGDLEAVFRRVRASAGVICTDNFLGHMGAYLGKPVFWINGSSDPEHVVPKGQMMGSNTGVKTRIVQFEPMPCRPCGHRCVNPVYKQCLLELRPETVLAQLEDWLAHELK